jgi:hypothetical protein
MVADSDLPHLRLDAVHANYRDSARNLLQYLALRRRDLRPLQLRLAALGLSSLGRAESHVLATVDTVLEVLHRLAGHDARPPAKEGTVDFAHGQRLLDEHTDALLGPALPGRAVRIMVTMPTEAGRDYLNAAPPPVADETPPPSATTAVPTNGAHALPAPSVEPLPSVAIASGEKGKARDIIAAIRTLKQIERDQRQATLPEKSILARFAGFGPVALSIFPDPATGRYKDDGWQSLGEELKSLLTPEEYDSTKRTTFNAFYTSPLVIDAIHEAIARLGIPEGATVLEPGCGIGNFMSRGQPGMRFIGVELDSISGRCSAA